jgi:broad specificity phosphatase PhoE
LQYLIIFGKLSFERRKKMKKIYIVTHASVKEDLPDPELTKEGKEQIKKLKSYLPPEIDYVVVGKGKRHKESYKILLGDRKPDLVSRFAGVPEVLSSDQQEMIFPDGRKISIQDYRKNYYPELYEGATDLLKRLLKMEGENALIVGGRIVPIVAGINPESGRLYILEKGKVVLEK